MRLLSRRTVGAVVSLAGLVAGCSGDMNLSSLAANTSVVGYTAANAFSPSGYSEQPGPNGTVRITAVGTPATPAARLEKIALARAADYGAEQNQKMFKAEPAQYNFRCGKSDIANKGQMSKVKPSDYRVVQIDVSYSSEVNDPSARPTKQTAAALKAELESEAVPIDVQTSASQEIASNCHR